MTLVMMPHSHQKFQVGNRVKCSSRCPKCVLFKGFDKIIYIEYDPEGKCSWYDLKRNNLGAYRSYELEKI